MSALAFGFMHGTAQQIPAAVIMGLFLGYLYVKFESIIMVITIHFINNSITCIFNAIELYCNDNIYEMVNVITAVAVIFAGIMSVILYIIKHSRDKKSQVGPLNNSEAMSAALSAPSLWCYLIIYTMITVINTISMNICLLYTSICV